MIKQMKEDLDSSHRGIKTGWRPHLAMYKILRVNALVASILPSLLTVFREDIGMPAHTR